MRPYLPGIVVGAAIALLGVVLGQVLLVVLGAVVGLLIVGISSMRVTQAAHSEEVGEDLSPESRILIRPLKKIFQEMEEAASGKSPSISPYIASEAMQECKRLIQQSAAALLLRDRLKRESRGEYDAQKSVADLQNRMSSSSSDEEKTSLQSALDARTQELGHYDLLKQGITKIETSVKQAEAVMAEMRARLIAASSSGLAEQGSDPLREAVSRMQTLSTSLSEAQEMLQGR